MRNVSMSDAELLKFAIENGMIDTALVQEKIEMQKRKELLDKHPYAIWQGKDEKWRTYIPDDTKGRKLIKKKEYSDIENAIIKYWSERTEDKNTFKCRFDVWVDRQKIRNRSENTIYRYQVDYKKCFEGYPIEKMVISLITDEDIYVHLKKIITDHNLTYKALKSIFGYIRGVFEKSVLDKLMTAADNPCQYVDLEMLRKNCREEQYKTVAERTMSNKEAERLMRKTHCLDYRNKHPNLVAYKAIEFAMLTGMRVGELSGLMWEDVDYEDGVIVIRHSEKYNRISKSYTVEKTKNKKTRYLPITDDMKSVLKEIKELEESNGWTGEFVFMNETGRVHCRTISSCMRNLTLSKEYANTKSIQTIRRTVNSKMRCNGVSAQVASSLIGNTKEVNEMHYSYNVEEFEKQKKYIQNAKLIERNNYERI